MTFFAVEADTARDYKYLMPIVLDPGMMLLSSIYFLEAATTRPLVQLNSGAVFYLILKC